MREIKDIKDYEGYYAITSDGEVLSTRYNRTLKPRPTEDGYLQVVLCVRGDQKPFYVHRLVAQAFVPNPEGLPEVNHIDENKNNNDVSNLEWVTAKDNCNHGTRNERMAKKHFKTVINLDTLHMYESVKLASALTGANKTSIASCCRGQAKTAGGYHWCYLEDYCAA